MNFKKYLDKKEMKPYKFAKDHELNHIMVWRAYKGNPISPKNAAWLSAACKGKVKILELIYGGEK